MARSSSSRTATIRRPLLPQQTTLLQHLHDDRRGGKHEACAGDEALRSRIAEQQPDAGEQPDTDQNLCKAKSKDIPANRQ